MSRDLKEGKEEVMERCGGRASLQRERSVQRPWGRTESGMLEEQHEEAHVAGAE